MNAEEIVDLWLDICTDARLAKAGFNPPPNKEKVDRFMREFYGMDKATSNEFNTLLDERDVDASDMLINFLFERQGSQLRVGSAAKTSARIFPNSFIEFIWEVRVEQDGNLWLVTTTSAKAKELADFLRENLLKDSGNPIYIMPAGEFVKIHNSLSPDVLTLLSGESTGKYKINQQCASGALNAYDETQNPPDKGNSR